MDRISRLLAILVLSTLAVACGDYGGGNGGGNQQNVVLGGGSGSGLGGLSQTEQVAAFASTVYPLLAANCNGCHAGFGPGTPHIAHSNTSVSYAAVIDNQKVNFWSARSSL